MRVLISVIFVLISNHSLSQTDSLTMSFLKEVIKRPSDSQQIVYTIKDHPAMFNNKIPDFNRRRIRNINHEHPAEIHLSKSEFKYIKQQLLNSQNYDWPDSLFNNSKRISSDTMNTFLRRDRNRVVYLFSKPIFIRDNSVCLVHIARLCCGAIYGPEELLFFRKQDGSWIKWIFVNGGAF